MKMKIPYFPEPVDLDERAEYIAKLHFSKKCGAPYWIKYQEKNKVNLSGIDSWEKLMDIPPQPEAVLQPVWNGGKKEYDYNPPADLLLPKAMRKEVLYQSQSSGSTQKPKKCIWSRSSLGESIASSNYYLERMGVPRNVDWMIVGPATLYQEYMLQLARSRGSNPPYFVSVPTEGIKPLFAKPIDGLDEGPKYYRRRIIEDSVSGVKAYLEGGSNIKVMIALPFNIDDFVDIPEMRNLDTILFVGFGMNGGKIREWKEAFPKQKILGFYTHFMNATAPYVPRKGHLDYYAAEPLVHFDVAEYDERRPGEVSIVRYGERGRICFTRAGNDIFWRQWEDAATRIRPCELFPWDGVRDVDRFVPMKHASTLECLS
ncbi:MAG: hypothetical protein QXU82_02565 [Candidatus Aenigmatarchaeota archaeon]